MKKAYIALFFGVLLFAPNTDSTAQEQLGRLYGKITLRDGDMLEGRIIWGDHETIWNHTFDANYDFYDHNRSAYWRQREYRQKRPGKVTAQFAVYFGDILTIERQGSRAVVVLKDEREYEVHGGDVGENIYVSDKGLGNVKIDWDDMEMVEFTNEPESYSRHAVENAYPIYGKVLTASDHVFKGFLLWDNDESLSSDIIDAEEGRYDRNIPFSKIKSIAPRSRRSSTVVLVTGKELVLSGTNDVNSENRGIVVADPNYGIVSIEWRDVERVDFEHNVPAMKYSDFKKGKPLYGTMTDDRGQEYTGFIRWDDDESMTSDFLNGESYNYEMKVAFGNIKEIRRRTRKSALVLFKNGVELRLSGSNDVNSGNKGIVILKNKDDEEGKLFEWDEFDKIVFKQ